jgi:hypothetical protein
MVIAIFQDSFSRPETHRECYLFLSGNRLFIICINVLLPEKSWPGFTHGG